MIFFNTLPKMKYVMSYVPTHRDVKWQLATEQYLWSQEKSKANNVLLKDTSARWTAGRENKQRKTTDELETKLLHLGLQHPDCAQEWFIQIRCIPGMKVFLFNICIYSLALMLTNVSELLPEVSCFVYWIWHKPNHMLLALSCSSSSTPSDICD